MELHRFSTINLLRKKNPIVICDIDPGGNSRAVCKFYNYTLSIHKGRTQNIGPRPSITENRGINIFRAGKVKNKKYKQKFKVANKEIPLF